MKRFGIVLLALLCGVAHAAGTSGTYTPFAGSGGGGAVSSVNGQTGAVSLNIPATWTLANPRVYAVDGSAGASGAGFADAASNSAADLATATAAAGAIALKTIEALAAILPRDGAGRRVQVVIRAGTYTGDLGMLLNGIVNYDHISIWGTDTNATAGSVAFDGSNNSLIYAGGITVPGLNAAGYNPTGSPTTTSVQLLQVGGGAPGFSAEAAVPLGWRIRWDVNTTTAALRNKAYVIRSVTSGTTLGTSTMAAVPVGADIGYIEKAGVIIPASHISQIGGTQIPLNIAGIDVNGALTVDSGTVTLGFSGCTSLSSQAPATINVNHIVQTVAGAIGTGTNVSVGGGLRNSGTVSNDVLGGMKLSLQEGTFAGNVELINPSAGVSAVTNAIFGAGLTWHGGAASSQTVDLSDGVGTTATPAMRIIGPGAVAGLWLRGTRLGLRFMDISGMGAKPALKLTGINHIIMGSVVSGSTGNTDVGLDLTASYGSIIVVLATPTVTGTAGDIRLGDGTITSWAAVIATPVKDTHGNQLITAGGAP